MTDLTDERLAEIEAEPFKSALSLAARLRAAEERAEAAEKDARRYRWLRQNCVAGRMESRGPRPDFVLNCDEPQGEWDAAIDAALLSEAKPAHSEASTDAASEKGEG